MSTAIKSAFAPLASIRLTVALLAMSTFIVFAGTVAQIDKDIWTVVEEYFRCYFTWIDLAIFCPRAWSVPSWLTFPFPGGWLIGIGLLVNILAAHAVRFKIYARGPRLTGGLVVLAAGALLTTLVIMGVFNKDIAHTEDDAFWRVLLRLGQGGWAAVVLMIGCLMVFRKRAGIVLLHSGIILLLVHEVFTGVAAVEGRMRIAEGESANYVEHTRSVELAFTDRSDPESDHITVVPRKLLKRGGLIQDDQLPVDIEVVKYMKNSDLVGVGRTDASQPNPATAGSGLSAIAIAAPEVSGTDASQRINIAAAYVKLMHKGTGQSLGTYMVAVLLERTSLPQQSVTVDGRTYELNLRFPRTYKPYSIYLEDFRHDKYIGTETPKNYSSLVRIIDKDQGLDRTVRIWMNNPLRYAGETFYQSSFEPGDKVTILQVVRNDGWMLPYLSCMIVGVGMMTHFGSILLGFLSRRRDVL